MATIVLDAKRANLDNPSLPMTAITCQCGRIWTNTPSGRQTHKVLYGHAGSGDVPTSAATRAVFQLVIPTAEMHNSNHRGHWSVAANKRKWMRASARAATHDTPRLTGPVTLTITFQFSDNRVRDLDNLEVKGAIDGAVDSGVIEDDKATILRSVTRETGVKHGIPKTVVLTFEFRTVGA
jgi:Holliday junction resolvase RusA-like endonuclease